MEAWIGTVLPVAFSYAPEGWLMAHGQMLRMEQYQGLYSILTTTYGGNGQPNFAIPDLRGRVPLGFGKGPTGSNYPIAASGGAESLTLRASHLPAHAHSATFTPKKSDVPVTIPAQTGDLAITAKLQASSAVGVRQTAVAGDMLGAGPTLAVKTYTGTSTNPVDLNGASVSVTGKAGTAAVTTTIPGVVTDGTVTVEPAGAIAPTALDNRMPYLALNFIICLQGLYPPKP